MVENEVKNEKLAAMYETSIKSLEEGGVVKGKIISVTP